MVVVVSAWEKMTEYLRFWKNNLRFFLQLVLISPKIALSEVTSDHELSDYFKTRSEGSAVADRLLSY